MPAFLSTTKVCLTSWLLRVRSMCKYAGSLTKAHELIAMYEEMGISKDRILIKVLN